MHDNILLTVIDRSSCSVMLLTSLHSLDGLCNKADPHPRSHTKSMGQPQFKSFYSYIYT